MHSGDGLNNPRHSPMNMNVKMEPDGMPASSQGHPMDHQSGPGPIRVQMVQHPHQGQGAPYPSPGNVRFVQRGPGGVPQGLQPFRMGMQGSAMSPPNQMLRGGSPMDPHLQGGQPIGLRPMGPPQVSQPQTTLSHQLSQPPNVPSGPPSNSSAGSSLYHPSGPSPSDSMMMPSAKQESSGMMADESMHPSQSEPLSHPPPPQAQAPLVPPPTAPQSILPGGPEGVLLEKSRLDELAKQIDGNLVLEDAVKDALVDMTEEFVNDLIEKMCGVMQMRNSDRLSVRDLELVLDLAYKMPVAPRAAVHVYGQPPTVLPRSEALAPSEAHKQRMAFIKRDIKKL